ncbi:MAG: hypothetical protein AB8F78_12640 [Saprospiraceae bacterium]
MIFVLGISGASGLVYNEFSTGSICPKILGVPACYIIALCLIIPFISHLLGWRNSVYYIGTGLAFGIAFYGTISQSLGLTECPKTGSGTPMCYISLAIFTSLIVLKFMQQKLPPT